MKKRLLSAALALAMVLTMLPLSVMAAAAATPVGISLTSAQNGIAVTKASSDIKTKDANGVETFQVAKGEYYATITASGTTTYYRATSGVIGGNRYYDNIDAAITAKNSNIILITDATVNSTLDHSLLSTLTIDLNGHKLSGRITIPATYTPAGGTAQSNGFSQLTIKDSTKSGSTYNGSSDVAINVGNGASAKKATSTTITLNNVQVGAITADYTTACTVNVYGSNTGAITLNGTSGGQINLGNGNTKGWADAVTLKTTGTAQGGTITATDAEATSIALSGMGASLTGTNLKLTDGITLFGLAAVDNDGQKSSLRTPTVTLYNGRIGGSITTSGTEVLTQNYTVTLNNNTQVNGINLENANVTVNNSAAGAITVKNGDVKLNGSATGPASAKDIKLGEDKKAASLTVTGTNVTTGDITKVNGTVNVTVPESDTNSFGELTTKVDNRGISGGVWGAKVPADNLNLNLRYQASSDGKQFRYYSDSQFQNVLDAYQVGVDTELNSNTTVTLVNDPVDSPANSITFKNGDYVLAVVKYGTANLPLVLPSSVNGHTVLKWSEYDVGNNLISEPTPGTTYSTPSKLGDRILNAQALDNTITKLVAVSSDVNGITARLNGNVITLSGAVPASNTTIEIKVTTDGKTTGGKPPIENQSIFILYDNGKVTFANQNADLPAGMSISNDYSTLTIGNGTASYTLNGSGLRVQADGLTNRIHGYKEDYLPVIVTVNCSGTGWTTVRKTELAQIMSNDYTTTIKDDVANSVKSWVSFKDSPAVKEALNAAVAGITQSQINSWILNAQNAACRKAGITNPTAADRAETGYSEVHLVAYMAVNVTNYNTANTPGALTMTLTPSYYVEVTGADGKRDLDTKYRLDPNNSSELSALRPVNNRSLGSLTGAVTPENEKGPMNTHGINFTLLTDSANFTNTYAHQGSTYGYEINTTDNAIQFRILHAVNSSLGQFIVDGQEPMVSRYDEKDGTLLTRYETLQAAVDDAKEDQYIDVNANYKGSCNITVTGTARKFTINTHGANKVTSNVSGVVAELAGGNEYQVQLTTNTLTPSGNVAITVVSVANGYARVSASSVKPGSVVTITAVPNVGYAATTPSVRYSTKTVASNILGVTAVGTNTWSFTVPADATGVTVTPGFVLIGSTTVPFTDVAANAWYYTGVEYCYNTVRGSSRLMQGMNDANTIFSPNSGFTRAQVVQILWNMKGRPSPRNTYNRFSDISSIHYAYNAMLWAVQNGYAEGYPDGTFRPNQYVTRQEMAVFLWRAAGKPTGYNTLNLNNYSDGSQVYDWAQSAMKWAVATGVLSGQSSVSVGRYLAPRTVAYRSEVAVTVMNFDKLAVFR